MFLFVNASPNSKAPNEYLSLQHQLRTPTCIDHMKHQVIGLRKPHTFITFLSSTCIWQSTCNKHHLLIAWSISYFQHLSNQVLEIHHLNQELGHVMIIILGTYPKLSYNLLEYEMLILLFGRLLTLFVAPTKHPPRLPKTV